MVSFVHRTAEVSVNAKIGLGVKVWHYSQIREGAVLGDNTTLGRSVYIGPGVTIGENSKLQNGALIYEPAILEAGVFIGPNVILTNDLFPRAVNVNGVQKNSQDWTRVGVVVKKGASIGAGSICVAPVEVGEWALVAAGSVVTTNVNAFSLVAGTPARWINWVGKAGIPLIRIGHNLFQCPSTGSKYRELKSGELIEGTDE